MVDLITIASPMTGGAVDKAAGIIRGVSVITEGPAVGHIHSATQLPVYIDSTTLAQMKTCAEKFAGGLKVKADHQSGVFATTGYLKDFRIDGERLRADLYILTADGNREKLLEMAASIPDTFGLSVSFSGQDEIRPDKVLARCLEIYSADLVPEPAANPTGLFNRKVDASPKANSMATDNKPAESGAPEKAPESDLLAQCRAMMEKATAEYNTRLQALEQALAALKPKEAMAVSGDGVTGSNSKAEQPAGAAGDFKALRAEVTELSAKILDLPKQLAKEFAGKLGLSPTSVSVADPAASATQTETPTAAFVSRVEKHFAATGSKARAMSLAIAEDETQAKGEGYRAFMAKPLPITYQRKKE